MLCLLSLLSMERHASVEVAWFTSADTVCRDVYNTTVQETREIPSKIHINLCTCVTDLTRLVHCFCRRSSLHRWIFLHGRFWVHQAFHHGLHRKIYFCFQLEQNPLLLGYLTEKGTISNARSDGCLRLLRNSPFWSRLRSYLRQMARVVNVLGFLAPRLLRKNVPAPLHRPADLVGQVSNNDCLKGIVLFWQTISGCFTKVIIQLNHVLI